MPKFIPELDKLDSNYQSTSYDSIVLNGLETMPSVVEVSKRTKVPFKKIIRTAVNNNVAIRRQPTQREDSTVISHYTEDVFTVLFGGENMNDYDPMHEGWDIEYKGFRVEIKATRKWKAKAKQGSKPDFYVIFKLDELGRLVDIYFLPTEILACREKGVPQTINLGGTQYAEKFKVTWRQIIVFFELAKPFSPFNIREEFYHNLHRSNADIQLAHPQNLNVQDLFNDTSEPKSWLKKYRELRNPYSKWCWS
ncbi:hypothetical protein ABRZ58_22640 [Vibrio vulnificus]|uniref:hypothetical protein n=1 Tax=Vibrio vulnificus TaxID=672 RepID=UPI001A208DCA|nr:hypothetical protein [Vibrio alginolyticus]HAS6222140.1 hypothetical protein [Vibrio vulnificus]HAT8530648.1 hypothetical protein [Vibrio vulnificus]